MFCMPAFLGSLSVALLITSTASANNGSHLFYDFVESPSGDILATLELSSLPALFGDVESLTFSPIGESLLGFGPTYLGDFDAGGGDPVIDVSGGLAGGFFSDNTPQPSSLFPPLGRVDINMPLVVGGDFIGLQDTGNRTLLRITGDWTLSAVPEPMSVGLCLTAALIGTGGFRRRRRNAR